MFNKEMAEMLALAAERSDRDASQIMKMQSMLDVIMNDIAIALLYIYNCNHGRVCDECGALFGRATHAPTCPFNFVEELAENHCGNEK